MPTSDSLTLRDALEEYYLRNPGFNGLGDFLGQPRDTVVGHDVIHVLFDLGPSSEEELIVETVTLFGCLFPAKKIVEMPKAKFAKELWKTFGPWRLMKRFVLTAPRMIRAAYKILRMKKKWPHFGYQDYMDMRLKDIREEFGIALPI